MKIREVRERLKLLTVDELVNALLKNDLEYYYLTIKYQELEGKYEDLKIAGSR